MEKRQRSIKFSNFPENTKENAITAGIWKTLADVWEDIDEVSAYSKHDTAGDARFKTTESMWKYMQSNAGKHRHTAVGRTIFVNADRMAAPTDDKAQDQAVRKLVRAMIEGNGGDGPEVKKHMDAKYNSGTVIWKDESGRVEGREGLKYQKAYDLLMKAKTAE